MILLIHGLLLVEALKLRLTICDGIPLPRAISFAALKMDNAVAHDRGVAIQVASLDYQRY